MEVMLSRILRYLNGCLQNDHLYHIGNFLIKHYTELEDYDMSRIAKEGHFTEAEILDFLKHLGMDSYEQFMQKYIADDDLRMSQMHARLLNFDIDGLVEHLKVDGRKQDFMALINELCEIIFKTKRIVIVGGLYPISVAVDFQTDMIFLGKEVIEYHHFDDQLYFNEDDLVIFITATGRMMEEYVKEMRDQGICSAYLFLITQNPKYRNYESVCADYVAHVLGKYDGIEFNYQIMMIFDLIRITFFQKYYRH